MCSYAPDKGEQMVRYYGYYSNVPRGKWNKQNQDGLIPCTPEANVSKKTCQRNWVMLIREIYEVDPLVCPKCNRRMRATGPECVVIVTGQTPRELVGQFTYGHFDDLVGNEPPPTYSVPPLGKTTPTFGRAPYAP